jgi:MinD-like ATPase involved in chromosome partitioning or flagellar assembly
MSVGVLVALGAVPFEPRVLGALHDDRLHVVRRCVDVADLLATSATRQAQVALVGLELRGVDTDVVSRVTHEALAVVGVVADSATADEAVLRQMGVDFVCAADDLATVVDTVLAAAGTREPAAAESVFDRTSEAARQGRATGRIVAVWGPSGAPGRSMVALGLGAEVAALPHDSLVVDADVYGGTIGQMLGVFDESSGLLAATRDANAGVLTVEALRRHCRQIGPRLRVLTGLPRADRWVEAKSVLVRSVLGTCRQLVDVTVVDCGFSLELDEEISYDTAAPRRNGATIEVLEQADDVVVVGRADPIGLGRLIRGLAELRSVVPSAEPLVVVNRVRPGMGWSRDDIAETLSRATGVSELSWLPDDAAACDRALASGETLRAVAPSSKLSKALQQIAGAVVGADPLRPRRRLPSLRTRTAARAR